MDLQPFVGPWLLHKFRNLPYTNGRTPWTSDYTVVRPLPTHVQIPVLERLKTVHTLDSEATVIDKIIHHCLQK
jgi:hypothetical protein